MSVRHLLAVCLLASADALNVRPGATPRVVNKAAAALGTTAAVLPTKVLAAEDGGWQLALPSLPSELALPSLPSLPAWFGSSEAHDLLVFFAQTVISWGVPTVAIGGLLLFVSPFGKKNDAPPPLPPALAKALGVSNEPKEFLQIERLNEKLNSFEYSFRKVSTSPGSALRVKTKADIERQLGAEFQSFNLDALTIEKVFNAALTYRKAEEVVTKRLEGVQAQLRALTLAPNAARLLLG